MDNRKRVFVCSPFGGTEHNAILAMRLCRRAVSAGLAPFAPHLLYPQWLDDADPDDREAGMACGLAWLRACDIVWALDVPPTAGMKVELALAHELGKPISKIPLPDLP